MTLFQIVLIIVIAVNCTFCFILLLAGLKILKQISDNIKYFSCGGVLPLNYLAVDDINSCVYKLDEILEDKLDKLHERNNLYDRFGKK